MAATDRHTRLVAWAKILLPLAALVILSTLFLAARPPATDGLLPYGGLDPEALAREPRIGAPDYAGVTADGTSVRFEAESARPDAPRPDAPAPEGANPDTPSPESGVGAGAGALVGPLIEATAPRARLDLPGGQSVRVRAEEGSLDRDAGRAVLRGAVEIEDSQGWRLLTALLEADLAEGLLLAPGPVRGSGPFGTLEAGSMRLLRRAPADHVLSFEGRVKLLYQPGE